MMSNKQKKMKCEEIEFNLPLYIDDILSDKERVSVEKHLPTCPLCRQKLSEFRDVRNSLRIMSKPTLPADLLANVRSAVSYQTKTSSHPRFALLFTETLTERIKQFLMPYSIAAFASLVIGFSLFFFIEAPDTNPLEIALNNSNQVKSSILLTDSNTDNSRPTLNLGTEDYEKISLTDRPPTLNHAGALVALTKSFVRGKMKDEEVVILADVFGNGIAKVAGVIEPSKDDQIMLEIQEALETDPETASFIPSKADNRSDKVTFILKIRRVDVETRQSK